MKGYDYPIWPGEIKKGSAWSYFKGKVLAYLYVRKLKKRIKKENFGKGRQAERERIIKLLSDPLHHDIRFPDEHIDCYTCVLIALIKGEK